MKAKSEHRLAETNEQRKKQLLQQLEKDLKERDSFEKKRGGYSVSNAEVYTLGTLTWLP
jgi:cytidylate kinase